MNRIRMMFIKDTGEKRNGFRDLTMEIIEEKE